MINQKLPQIIEDVGFDFHWSNEKVWELDIPVEEIDVSELEWHFDIPFWNQPGEGYYDLKPNEVLADQEKYRDEVMRTMNADLSYPLDIMYWKNRWLLLDGLHRLVKARLLGMTKIRVRKVSKKHIPLIKK